MMRTPNFLYTLNQVLRIACVLLIAILIGFEAIPITQESDTQYINQASLQRVRSQIFVKSVYVLRYRSDGERVQAISDLQVVLPLFQQEQSILLGNNAMDVQAALQNEQPDYLALVTAVQTILAHPNDPNLLQIDIVLSHERSYLHGADSLVKILQQHADELVFQLFCIEVFIEVLIVIVLVLSFFTTQRLVNLTPLAAGSKTHMIRES